MKIKVFPFILLIALSSPFSIHSSLIKVGTDPGYIFAYHEDAKTFFKGFALPFIVRYAPSEYGLSFVGTCQYNFLQGHYDSSISWTDPLTLENKQHFLSAQDTYHVSLLATGFDYTFRFNWQDEQRKFLKYFLPYLGADLSFFFPVISRESDLKEGQIPGLFYNTYKSHNRLLTPTIGMSARLGTKILMSERDRLNLKVQYAILVPEQTIRKLYLNHFLSISLGYERRLLTPRITQKKLEKEKGSGNK